jgi:hypothetical protein
LKYRTAFPLALILLWGGCSSKIPTPAQRYSTLSTLAAEHNLSLEPIITSHFKLMSISSAERCQASKNMHVYIEGDGFAWKTKTLLSDNSTPINPLSAKLMFIDQSICKIYLARPCQYIDDSQCSSKDWSSHRFSPDVIQTYQEALDNLKKLYKIDSYTLVGYSGGGTIATLIAANRNDVKRLITVAGNLDPHKWVMHHGISQLDGSLNPTDYIQKLESINQLHLIGKEDKVIPSEIFFSYQEHFSNPSNIHYQIFENISHTHGWEKVYKKLLEKDSVFLNNNN